MEHVAVRRFQERDREAVVELWRRCDLIRPWNDPDLDIDRNLATDGASLLVAVLGDAVVGSVMVGYDGHRGWINYLAVDGDHRRHGIGELLVDHVLRHLGGLGCPKVNLQVRSGNESAIAFYQRLGFTVDDVVSMGKRLIDDRG